MFETPLAPEKLEEILTRLRAGLEELLGEQLEAVYLYGSHARGDARPDSDIDVLIIMKEDFDYGEVLSRTLDLTAALSLEHDVVISRAFFTRERFEHEKSPFLMNVRREAVIA